MISIYFVPVLRVCSGFFILQDVSLPGAGLVVGWKWTQCWPFKQALGIGWLVSWLVNVDTGLINLSNWGVSNWGASINPVLTLVMGEVDEAFILL